MQHIEDLVKLSDFSKETDLEPKLESMLQHAAKKKVSLGQLMEEEGLSSQNPAKSGSKTRSRTRAAEKAKTDLADPVKSAPPLKK